MSGDSQLATVKEHGVHDRMALPSAEGMTHCRTETTGHGRDGDKTHSATAIFLLKHLAQIGRQNIRFDKGVAEIGNTNRTGCCGKLVECLIEPRHATHGRIAVIFNARHARTAGVHKGGLHLRRRGQQTVRLTHRLGRTTHVPQDIHTPQHTATHRNTWQQMHQQQCTPYDKRQQTRIFQ